MMSSTNLCWALALIFTISSASPLQQRNWGDWQSSIYSNKATTKTDIVSRSSTATFTTSLKGTGFPMSHNSTNATSTFNTSRPHNKPARPHNTPQVGSWWGGSEDITEDTTSWDSSDDVSADYTGWGGSYNPPTVNFHSDGSSGNAGSDLSAIPIAAPIVTMTPSTPPGHDASDRQHLLVSSGQSLFFAEGDANSYAPSGSRYLSANTRFSYPSIVLDHTDYASATVNGNSITVKFTDRQAYLVASSSWPHDGSTFVIITNIASTDGHFIYYQVSSIAFDENKLSCTGTFTTPDFNDLLESFDLSWGQLSNSSNSSLVSTSTAGSRGTYTSGVDWSGAELADLHNMVADSDDYLIWDEAHFKDDIHEFAPGLTDDDWNDYQTSHADDAGLYGSDGEIDTNSQANIAMLNGRSAKKGKSATTVSNAKQQAAAKTKKEAPRKKGLFAKVWKGVKAVVNVVKKVVSYVDGTPHTFDKAGKWEFPKEAKGSQFTTKQEASSYWTDPDTKKVRQQFELYKTKSSENKKFEVYCVDCGIKADATVGGVAAFHITKGITRAEVFLNANFYAGLHIGVAVEASIEKEVTKELMVAGIPGFSVPNVITIGPMVTVDARAKATLSGAGTLFFGGSVEIKDIKAVLNLQDSSKNVPLKIAPQFKPIFEANAEINAGLTLSLPVTIAVGINVAKGKFEATGGITTEPSVGVTVQYKASASLTGGKITGSSDSETCNGIDVGLKLQNEFYVRAKTKLFGKENSTPKKTLGGIWEKKVASWCIGGKNSGVVKRQFDNTTFTNSTDTFASTFGDGFIALDEYDRNSTDLPFEPILTGFYTDEDHDGINDIDEFWWPPEVEAYLDDDHPEYYVSSLNLTERREVEDSTLSGMASSKVQDDGLTMPSLADVEATVDTAYNYTVMSDTTFTLIMIAQSDGSVGVQNKQEQTLGNVLWQIYEDVVVGDSEGRTLYYYSEVMNEHQFSPLRLADADHLPHKTQVMNFINMIFDDDTKLGTPDDLISDVPAAVFVGSSSTQDEAYWPIVCNYEDTTKPSQIFVTSDLEAGTAKLIGLSQIGNKEMIPFGRIANCDPLPLVNGESGTQFSE